MILLASPSPTNEHAFGVDDGPDHSPFPVPFPIWVTSTKPYWVTLAKHRRDSARRTGLTIPEEKVTQVRQWIENYRRMKDCLEKISDINRELLRRDKAARQKKNRKSKARA